MAAYDRSELPLKRRPSASQIPATAPAYLSSRSADVILSDVRPTKLKPDALHSINVLLDELLWLILSASRSFLTEKLKGGLVKVLPTTLGKEALLEAEVELRAYWERSNPANGSLARTPSDDNAQEFPLQAAFELLRLKCEAYSTLNDADEDADAEARWHTKIAQSNDFTPSKFALIAPAALYITAILEAVCEHILSNTGRVTARDSSRTAATLQDLFVGLSEDDAIYPLFKTMRVHAHIESQIKAAKPRRSKSFTRNDRVSSPSRGAPPPSEPIGPSEGSRHKTRLSSDSGTSNHYGTSAGASTPYGSRASLDKSKTKRMFQRASGERDVSQNGYGSGDIAIGHKRSESALSEGNRRTWSSSDQNIKNNAAEAGDDESLIQEFDDLMRSGATMKVSLTPDRLKTFEVYNKEKNQRGNKAPPPSAVTAIRSAASTRNVFDSSGDNSASEDAGSEYLPGVRSVHPIDESGEENVSPTLINPPRPRHTSLSKVPSPMPGQRPPSSKSRARSISVASSSASFPQRNIGRKGSIGSVSAGPLVNPSEKPVQSMMQPNFDGASRPRAKMVARNRDSLDLDDIMNGSSDPQGSRKPPFTPKSAITVGTGTRDLLSFLNDGPPDMPSLVQSVSGTSDGKAKSGRFRSMVSRLTRGGSMEKLGHSGDESPNAMRKASSNIHPPPVIPPPLSAKKSLRNISAATLAAAAQPIPPRQTPMSPPISPAQSGEGIILPPPSSYRQPPAVRKAIPPLNPSTPPNREVDVLPIIPPRTSSATSLPSTPTKLQSESQQQFKSTEPEINVNTKVATQVLINGVSKVERPVESKIVVTTPCPGSNSAAPEVATHRPKLVALDCGNFLSPPATPNVQNSAFASHAQDLRRLMAKANTADECRLLLDMFLVQAGFKAITNEVHEPPSPIDCADERQQKSLVEVLLSNGDEGSGQSSPSSADTGSYDVVLPSPRSAYRSPPDDV